MAADGGLPFASLPGLGDRELEGFPAERCPEQMPDLSRHFSITADVLKEEPALYDAMRSRQTPMGVTFAKCIKTGMDNRGHPMIKTLGAVAGDADCYDTFQPFFDKLISSCFGQAALERPHLASPKRFIPAVVLADPSYVVSSHLRVSRNVQGLRFVPSMLRSERAEVERMLVKALLGGLLEGDYFPLAGSKTYAPKPGGMQAKEELLLTQCGRLFREPDSPAVLSTGSGRHWPDGRGVFTNQDRTLTAWINEEEHLKLMADRQDGQLLEMLGEMVTLLSTLERLAGGFAKSDRLGYLNSSPGNVGTAMTASMVVKLPLLKLMKKELGAWCKSKDLLARGALDEQGLRVEGLVELSHRQKLGVREEDMVKELIQRVSELIRAEKCMERGMSAEAAFDAVAPRDLTPVGAEDEEYPGVDVWAHVGDQLGEMLQGYVSHASRDEVKVRVGRALMASSISGCLETAAPFLKAPPIAAEVKGAQDATIPFKHLPSVGSNLLPLPLPLRNLEEEERAKQKAEAAARIQAIQRGRAQRAEAKAKAKAKAQAKALPTEEEMEQRKALLRTALEGALEDGTLERVLSEATYGTDAEQSSQDKEAAFENLRQRLANDLMLAAEDGRLEQILTQPKANQTEMIRKKMAESMLAAAEDGRLEHALAEEQRKQDRERVRKAAATSILAAAEDGRLERTLSKSESEQRQQDLERVRKATAESILAAAENGRLERTLTSEQRKQDLERVRKATAESILAAAEDGRLERTLSGEQRRQDMERVRKATAESILAAAEDGRLGQALTVERKKKDVEMVRQKAGATLLAAAENGRLEIVLAQRGEEVELGRVRKKIADGLLLAADDGTLEEALARTMQKSSDQHMEDIRSRMATSLLEAVENGSLELALEESGQVGKGPLQDTTSTALTGLPSDMQHTGIVALANQTAKSHLAGAREEVPHGAAAVQRALMQYERRIGTLTAAVQQAERGVLERMAEANSLEVAVAETKAKLRMLTQEGDSQKKLLEAEELRTLRLQDGQRQLMDELDFVYLKQRHAQLELDLSSNAYTIPEVTNQ